MKCHDFTRMRFGNCPIKDDFKWLENKILDADGLVVVMPCFEKSPPSEFKAMMDRTGPANDVYFRLMAKELREKEPERFSDDDYVNDGRVFKTRYASFISLGGSDWTQLGLPMLLSWCTSMGFIPVDKLEIQWCLGLASDTERMERIRQSGAHVAKHCASPETEPAFIGDPGHCPICHNDAFILGNNANETRCVVCGVVGTLAVSRDGTVTVHFAQEALNQSTFLNSGRKKHLDDLNIIAKKLRELDFSKHKEITERVICSSQVSVPD